VELILMMSDCHIGGAPSLKMIGDVAAQSRRTATAIFGSHGDAERRRMMPTVHSCVPAST
jgi:hypothetical protein